MIKNIQLGFRFTKKIAWKFFLVVGFPIHFWALLLWFQDFDTVAQRTNAWDAFGEGGYFLSYALFESVVIFAVLILILLLLPRKWDQEAVFVIAGTLYLIAAAWFMVEQGRYLPMVSPESWIGAHIQRDITLASNTGKLLALLIPITFIVPLYGLIRFEKARTALTALFDRLGVLSLLYLFLDFAGLVIVLIRII
ncbi:MAG TPA: hypothetical protein VJ965_10305 [Anaerolineales bacterium]|nr:hypothetical protein [Anaerolineales bacterium]